MRFIAFLTGVVLFLLAAVGSVSAADPFEEGKRYFAAGDYATALALFQEAFREEPKNLDASFYLGRAAYELGDFETAVMAFERVLIMQPQAERVKLELARAYQQLGSREAARQYFRAVEAADPPAAVWQNIQMYMATLDAPDRQSFVTGYASLGAIYDDNVGAIPGETVDVAGLTFVLDQAQESDWGLHVSAGLNHVYRFDQTPYAWKSSLVTYNNLYADQGKYDLNYVGLETGLMRSGNRASLELQGIGGYAGIDHSRYYGMFGFDVNVSYAFSDAVLLVSGASWLDKTYYDNHDRDATTWAVRLNPVLNFKKSRLSLLLRHEQEAAQQDVYSYRRLAGSLRYDQLLPRNLSLYASIRCQTTEYDDNDPLFGEVREDDETVLEAGISKVLWKSSDQMKSLSGKVSHTYTDTHSNLSLYKYSKNVTLTTLTFAF